MSFYVTLPSNASTEQHNNTQSNYTTELDTPINLTGPYEVALVEFSFREFIEIDVGEIIFNNNKGNIPFTLKAFENEPIESFIRRINNDIYDYYNKHELYVREVKDSNLQLSNNNTTAIREWWNECLKDDTLWSQKLDNVRSTYGKNIPSFTLSPNSIFLKLSYGSVQFTGACVDYLNLFPKKFFDKSTDLYYLNGVINFYDYLMVYTDVVSYQYVGDTFAPLIRTVCKTGRFSETTEKIYTNPHYLPVSKSYINSINIDIRDPSGTPVKFASKLSKVLAKLHFRPS